MGEISKLLEKALFVKEPEEKNSKDRWSKINEFRSYVSPAIKLGLSEIISPYFKQEYPIVELGSGIGYELPSNVSSITLRTQPSHSECQLLSQSSSEPIYQLDMEGIYNTLAKTGKKIPLFFALNVFDFLFSEELKPCLKQISQLQNSGDRILMLLDVNPCLKPTMEKLERLYPEHAVFPYFPLSKEPAKTSVILVPFKYVEGNEVSEDDLASMFESETMNISKGYISEQQYFLHLLQKKLDLKVICLEDFYVDEMKKELELVGYKSKSSYHNSFTTGKLPKDVSSTEDLVYKPVTDTLSVRQWSLTDPKLINSLNKKGLKIPEQFNEAFLKEMREKGEVIMGTEFLIIEATKN